MSEAAFISFVVIAYNEAGNIGRTLGAITSFAGLGRYEVIINDGSGDGTADVVAAIAGRTDQARIRAHEA